MGNRENATDSIFYKCNNCQQQFSLDSFRIAVLLHGIIFLIGKHDGYIGIVCPNCINTTLKKISLEQLLQMKNKIGDVIALFHLKKNEDIELKFIGTYKPSMDGSRYEPDEAHYLEYNTFCFERGNILGEALRSHGIYYWLESVDAKKASKKIPPNNLFCPYIINTRIVRKEPIIIGFLEQDIQSIVSFENKNKNIIFPRYYYSTNNRRACEKFCDIKGPNIFEDSVYVLENFNHTEYSKNHSLMELLTDTFIKFEYSTHRYKKVFLEKKHLFREGEIPDSLFNNNVITEYLLKNKADNMKIIKEIWANYEKGFMQKILEKKRLGFVLEFKELTKKTFCSEPLIIALQEKYLHDIHNSVISAINEIKEETKKFEERISNSLYFKVSENFPTVHITSKKVNKDHKIQSLIVSSWQEIQILYDAILKVGVSGHKPGNEEKWKDATLATYDKKLNKSKLIKKRYLEKKDLYLFQFSKEKRDFFGRLFQEIVEDSGLGKVGYQKLYEIYLRMDGSNE